MKATVEVTVCCTIEDQFLLMEQARQEVENSKARDDWELYYPGSPSEALQLLIRSSIASRLQSSGSVTLLEIGHSIKDLDFPT